MYGHPHLSGLGSEPVISVAALVAAIKRRQLLTPNARLTLRIGDEHRRVSFNGVLEVDATPLSITEERELDQRLAGDTAALDDLHSH